MSLEKDRSVFIEWLGRRLTSAGTGDADQVLEVDPSGKYWLGRLQSREAVRNTNLGDRGERLEPCAMGIRLRPASQGGPWKCDIKASVKAWLRDRALGQWTKTESAQFQISIDIPSGFGRHPYGRAEMEEALRRVTGQRIHSAFVEVEVSKGNQGVTDLVITLINDSPQESHDSRVKDMRLYECSLRVSGLETVHFELEALEDSFRYDRRVPAYGINCGVEKEGEWFSTVEATVADKKRPRYWSLPTAAPDFSFNTLRVDPVSSAKQLLSALRTWGESSWSEAVLIERKRSEAWTDEMSAKALSAAGEFGREISRIESGIRELESNQNLLNAFRGMNEAIERSANGKYNSWRPFQFGFLLANITCITSSAVESDIVDVVWFATGGGKTETYLGLLLTSILYDRMTGKISGVTAWSRFPLRMLSLQQTQRFADALASAELVRRNLGLGGAPFSLGFFVGDDATPNKIEQNPTKSGAPDPDDETMPSRYQTLDYCPFCRRKSIAMSFDRKHWRLMHCCENDDCPWPEEGLPIYIVDEEIYRFLPTVIVGTLDKAASISRQAAMAGLVGAPRGLCKREGHGYTYAVRRNRPTGCLVPGCSAQPGHLPMDPKRYGPAFRLQDELHLLRDSLGAVDSHYESLYDALQEELCGFKPKILASSATLTGYEKQIRVLYQRRGRVFPVPSPKSGSGFWTSDSNELMRRFVAIAPKGVTVEYTVDSILRELQAIIRWMVQNPQAAAGEIGVGVSSIPDLVSLFGTNVVYGNTLRDLEAVGRSLGTQLPGNVNSASLTGKTGFGDVRSILDRLERPEAAFEDRLHIITASSMMSHGVDIDRLNVMIMLGLPLATSEFIQATARVGRRYPSIVFVIHKIGRERDAGIFRSFPQFVAQGDRFVDPIPVTRRSRRVLEKTMSGLTMARLLMLHEPKAGSQLTTVKSLKDLVSRGDITCDKEIEAISELLKLNESLDEPMRKDLKQWIEEFWRNINSPPSGAKYPSDLSPTGSPMLSLRDVEQQVPVFGRRIDMGGA